MLRMKQWLALPVLLGLFTGCGHLQDCCDEHIMKMKCNQQAKRAWHQSKSLYHGICDLHDFGEGYRRGYIDICLGSDGCAPALPPRKYWSTCYSCEEGHAKIMAWFDGYHHGMLAAVMDGCSGQCHLLTGFDLYHCNVPAGAEHNLYVEGVDGLEPESMGTPHESLDDYLPRYPGESPDQSLPTPIGEPYLMPQHGPQLSVPAGPDELRHTPAGQPESFYPAGFQRRTAN